jgi:alpha-L-rhamnosidase
MTTATPHLTASTVADTGWTAKMITGPDQGAPLLRRSIRLDSGHGDVVAASLRITALGTVDAWINGRPASQDLLTPGWTSYEQRLRFAQWDVTDLLQPVTSIVLLVGNGWYRGRLGWLGLVGVYGPQRAAAAELTVSYADGHVQTVITDDSWESAPSAVLADDLYDGETVDARGLLPEQGHTAPADAFQPVMLVDFDPSVLEPYVGPPIRRQEEIAPTVIGHTETGELLLDFGQNLVGWLRIRVSGRRGDELTVHHAEVLEDGDLSLRPLRSAKAVDRFVLSGREDVFEPTLTFHGFRYARIAGWTGTDAAAVEAVRAVVIGSELRRTGRFNCSDPSLNKLHENVVWGMRGNFVDLPTDCPQRDERMGYVGDLAAFAPTAVFLYDVETFLRDWFRDLNVEQRIQGGQVPLTVPNTLKYEPSMFQKPPEGVVIKPAPMAMWQDGAVWIPWAMWEQYGDIRVLEQRHHRGRDRG